MRNIITLCGLLILTACGNQGTTYNSNDFSISLMPGWTITEPPIEGFPNAKAALLKKDSKGGNIVLAITSRPLSNDEAVRFIATSLVAAASLPEFEEINREEAQINGSTSILLQYKALPPDKSIKQRFVQISTAKDSVGYLLKARIPNTIDDDTYDELKTIMSSFTPFDAVSSVPSAETAVSSPVPTE